MKHYGKEQAVGSDAEQVLKYQQMTAARDRQKLTESLHYSEDYRPNVFHIRSPSNIISIL